MQFGRCLLIYQHPMIWLHTIRGQPLGHSATHRRDEILSCLVCLVCLTFLTPSTPIRFESAMACFAIFVLERCDVSIVPKSRTLELWQTLTGITAVLLCSLL